MRRYSPILITIKMCESSRLYNHPGLEEFVIWHQAFLITKLPAIAGWTIDQVVLTVMIPSV